MSTNAVRPERHVAQHLTAVSVTVAEIAEQPEPQRDRDGLEWGLGQILAAVARLAVSNGLSLADVATRYAVEAERKGGRARPPRFLRSDTPAGEVGALTGGPEATGYLVPSLTPAG